MNELNKVKTFRLLTSNAKGMSLIEILIALTLLGFTATFIAGKVFDRLNEGSVQTAKIQVKKLEERLMEFRRHCGKYPTSDQGFDALIEKPATGECKRYAPGGYIQGGKIPIDPWDNEYVFDSDGKTYEIISYGADGVEGGDGYDKDISSKDL
ncbi:type II secretion system major pseudopilin GspG [Bacteriovoracaceae bacterium]|nr:type II secretion system major pseudopilin GspG [Bacteriovoracaceae bacterium]